MIQYLTRDQVDLTDRKVAIVDPTGELYPTIAAAAEARNQSVFETDDDGNKKQVRPQFLVERFEPEGSELRTDKVLSDKVKQKELFAFLIIKPEALNQPGGETTALAYHTETPSFSELPNWLEQTINNQLQAERMEELSIDPAALAAVTQRTPLKTFGLVKQDKQGQVKEAEEQNRIATFAVPFGGMMLMFMMIMTVAPTCSTTCSKKRCRRSRSFWYRPSRRFN